MFMAITGVIDRVVWCTPWNDPPRQPDADVRRPAVAACSGRVRSENRP